MPPYVEDVLELVDLVPPGRVVTYSQVAEMLGSGGARAVGNAMAHFGSMTSWWRVVRASGEPPRGHEEEALRRYAEEGTPMVGGRLVGTRVDLERARWAEDVWEPSYRRLPDVRAT